MNEFLETFKHVALVGLLSFFIGFVMGIYRKWRKKNDGKG